MRNVNFGGGMVGRGVCDLRCAFGKDDSRDDAVVFDSFGLLGAFEERDLEDEALVFDFAEEVG